MNKLEYYNRQKEDWNATEIDEIRNQYESMGMTISEIADIHRRTPGSISYKLKNIGLITHNTHARGYLDYKNSDLYKEIVENGNQKPNVKQIKKERAYEKLVIEHNQKEEELSAKIKFYKENTEQLFRIYSLETEFSNLQTDIQKLYATKMREAEEKRRMQEYIQIISDNCKDAYQMYLLNVRNYRKNPHEIQINTIGRKYYINYSFNKIDDKRYNVKSNIPNYGHTINGKFIDGTYDVETGAEFKF